jgi:hypothetical protein
MHNQSHWDTVYSTKQAETVSWFQPHAALSLEIIERVTGGQPSTLIDVGSGASTLVDDLLDRAVFHFLTDPADRAAYVAQVRRAVKPGGHVIVAAFGLDGPSHCSGLPVMRFSQSSLHSEFGDAFELLEHVDEAHRTPGGAVQHFVYCHCRFD